MSTFYGYAERQAEDNVDWSVIGKEITTMLQTEAERRETLKTELDNSSRKYGETLSNAPTGQHEGASSGVLEFASNAEQARLIQDRLLKSGQLKVKDYLKQRQNLTDGTTGLFAAAKEFQAAFEAKASRMNDDEAMELEFELFKLTEGFGNWNSVGAYINPTNYEVSMGKKKRVMGKDGKYVYEMGDRPDEFFTVAELRNFISLKLDRYDVKGALDKHAASLAPMTSQIVVETPDGYKTIKISDATGTTFDQLDDDQKKVVNDFIKAEEDMIKEMMSNMYNNTSILTDYIGGYSFTWNPDEAGDKKILLEKDPQNKIPIPKFDPKQEKAIEEALRRGIRQRIDKTYSETFVQKREKSATLLAWEKGEKNLKTNAQGLLKAWIQGASAGYDPKTSKNGYSNVVTLHRTLNPGKDVPKLVRIDKVGGENIQFIFEKSGEIVQGPKVNLADKGSYVTALKTIFPTQLKSFGEDALQNLGKKYWRKGENDNIFNQESFGSGISKDMPDASQIPTKFDMENFKVDKTATQSYSAINKSGLFGIFDTYKNKNKREIQEEVGNKQVAGINNALSSIGKSTIPLRVSESANGMNFKNSASNADIDLFWQDATDIPKSQEALMNAALNYATGVIPNEEALRQSLQSFLNLYSKALNNNNVEDSTATVTIGGNGYSIDDMKKPDKFNILVETVKKLTQSQRGGTSTGKKPTPLSGK
jgi:hypothetical protein